MRKKIILGLFISLFVNIVIAQTYNATIAIEEVNVSGSMAGEDIIVPVRLVEISGGLIMGFQFYIEFDHSVLTWKGSSNDPLTGIAKIPKDLPYDPADWVFNDNGSQIAAIYMDNDLKGYAARNGELFFELIFTYNGGLGQGNSTPLIWGEVAEIKDGMVLKGETKMASEKLDYYILKKINGLVIN
jgi:hypothetical protein